MTDPPPRRRPFRGERQHLRGNFTVRGPVLWLIAAVVALPYLVGLVVIVQAVIERLSR